MSVTIKDVAKAAGVSVATVSRVLNNSSAVSDETAAAVNEVINEMGYSPNFRQKPEKMRDKQYPCYSALN